MEVDLVFGRVKRQRFFNFAEQIVIHHVGAHDFVRQIRKKVGIQRDRLHAFSLFAPELAEHAGVDFA